MTKLSENVLGVLSKIKFRNLNVSGITINKAITPKKPWFAVNLE